MLLAIGLCGSFRIADGACFAAGPGCEVYESAMSQDSEQRHLAAIDVERERDGLHLKILKHVPLMIALHLRMFSTHTLTHTHTCVCVYKYIYIYILCILHAQIDGWMGGWIDGWIDR